jgi:hypothetical protein
MINIQYPIIRSFYEEIGFPIREKPFQVNLLGVRSAKVAGKYSDTIACFFTNSNGNIYWRQYPASTVPTGYWLLNPMQKKGCAVLAPGYHKDIWIDGLHKGKYPGLLQRGGDVTIYRDNSKDMNIDLDPLSMEIGQFGINMHDYWSYSDMKADQSSAGCQVLDQMHVNEILECWKWEKNTHKSKFLSYGLVNKEVLQDFIRNKFDFKNHELEL